MKKINTFCIVDDDDIYQFTTSLLLKKTDLVNKIIVFSNGLKAINFLKDEMGNIENIPDILFLDVNMPVMDGWEFLEEYLIIKPMIPKTIVIYMVTSSVDEKDVLRAKSISALSGYLVKPISSQNIEEVILGIFN
ncbi:response regulator receiver domain-containing protein [Flavobacterium tiangeerense]|uniref:Response regulator receiver domain-containing protein n=1 Tax=Flavobacterium tiangeerense TaxID=459471 RepID=A0ABY3FN22_9FLAO|nr:MULTISPECIES: response regulator [Flavobacterium]QZK91012.1 response regulator [Flavobacterium sp. CHNK8]TWI03200.1 response regulator receiver domain-containing protein [Flavobacterium tiangeerense]